MGDCLEQVGSSGFLINQADLFARLHEVRKTFNTRAALKFQRAERSNSWLIAQRTPVRMRQRSVFAGEASPHGIRQVITRG